MIKREIPSVGECAEKLNGRTLAWNAGTKFCKNRISLSLKKGFIYLKRRGVRKKATAFFTFIFLEVKMP